MEIFAIIFVAVTLPLCIVSFYILGRETVLDQQGRREQLDKEYRKMKERHRRLGDALERYHTYQHQRMLQIGTSLYRDPEFTPVLEDELEPPSKEDMDLLINAGVLLRVHNDLYNDVESMARDWRRMGQTLYDVLEAAPDPDDCVDLTPEEFEDIIRRRLDEKRNRGDT